jgi:hypothetical protein
MKRFQTPAQRAAAVPLQVNAQLAAARRIRAE